MPCEDNYRDFCRRIKQRFRVLLTLGSRVGNDMYWSREKLTRPVEKELRDHIRESLFDPDQGWRCRDAILVGYVPGHKRLPREVLQLDVAEHKRVIQFVSTLPIPAGEGISARKGRSPSWREPRFKRGLVCYAYVLALSEGRWACLFGRCSYYILLTQSLQMRLIFGDGAFDKVQRLEKGSVVIDSRFEYILYEGCLYFQNPHWLGPIFQYGDPVEVGSEKAVNYLVENVDIENSEQFKKDCAKSKMMKKKMAEISEQPYLKKLTTENIIEAIKTANMGDEMIERTKEGVRIRYDPHHKAKMLKILDDDFLTSPMTGKIYDAISKRAIR